jgi:CRP/FNR family transcriptional regulator, anaerobic regulatory protein
MISHEHSEKIRRSLPVVQHASPQLLRELMQAASFVRIPAGKDVFVEGDDVDAIALLISGVVRVYKIGETGREITLYRFGLGESCVLTANAILSRQTFPALATVEQDAEAVMVPAAVFRDWVRRYDVWQDFVFSLLSHRLASMLMVVEEVAFGRMDVRLAKFLQERCRRANPIQMTHHEIAAELGSSREVISRLLSDLSSQGIISQERGKIVILDEELLESRLHM